VKQVYRYGVVVMVLCMSVLLAACGGTPTTAAPAGATQAAGSENVDQIAAALTGSGLTVVQAGQAAGPSFFDLAPSLLNVNGETVEVYVFSDPTAAQTAAATVSDLLARTRWAAPPHFFVRGSSIAYYLGSTQEIVSSLTQLYGSEIVAQVSEPTGEGGGDAESVSSVNIYMIALNDNGATGDAVGCGDSVIPVPREITPTASPIEAALTELFAHKEQVDSETGFYNALYQSNLAVESATVENGLATVYLTGDMLLGGECDTPRFKAQIEYTVLQFPGVEAVDIFINNHPIDDLLSGQG
jgi:hypothetical protein